MKQKPKEQEGPFHTDTSLRASRLAWRPEERFSVTHSGKTEPILPMLSADTGRLELQGGATKRYFPNTEKADGGEGANFVASSKVWA
jgi:hypothetical protein